MLVNIIGFNISWFGLLYWGNAFIPFALALLACHFLFISKIKKEWLFVVVVSIIGIAVDSLLQYLGFFIFAELNHLPFWLGVLWLCFACTICHSLHFLARSRLAQLAVGAFLAPLSYLAGLKFQVVLFNASLLESYLVLSGVWALLFMLFFALRTHLLPEKTITYGEFNHV